MAVTSAFCQQSMAGKMKRWLMQSAKLGSEVSDILTKLLHHEPKQRGTLEELEAWAMQVQWRSELALMPFHVTRWSRRDSGAPMVFGLTLPLTWKHSGKTIGELGMMHECGVQVLLCVKGGLRKAREVLDGKATTVMDGGDWICFGVSDDAGDIEHRHRMLTDYLQVEVGDERPSAACERAAKDPNFKGIVPFLPEFDVFHFPEYCNNAVLGPPEFANEGQNALDLRHLFEINLAGIVSEGGREPRWFPGPSEERGGLVRKGDKGLIIRVPPADSSGQFIPSVEARVLLAILEEERFRNLLNLGAGSTAAEDWRRKACMVNWMSG
eukprot:NODE_266_length_1724_cov_215.144997.p1 GENE.NODE_266_length_1724_cov_215.144997~~NODE_266_length_1724_cov_215.144997.p1  ORF type:complete len:325 (+),score=81.20 NODE_266_length_1724_cov_215.144997:373-1347(+)